MLFNSYIFIFAFLPLTLAGFFLIGALFRGERSRRAAVGLLVVASLIYYGWWNPVYLWLIGASIGINYSMGLMLGLAGAPSATRRTSLVLGIVFNLGLLGYFKYAGLFDDTLEALTGSSLGIGAIVLPLAISFFTFQQIAYLVDAYQGKAREYSLLDYCLFVTFFPQLIAGPIVHHKEMLPQFEDPATYRPQASNLSVGLAFFAMGLFKKVVIADSVAPFASAVFDGTLNGAPAPLLDAWIGALAYTAQIYFDFSGYSDMAIGLARMFGIRLPVNFDSPYKAKNIVEFWRRWHITLSRFLRDYLYIPLGGNRKGKSRRYINLLITMLLGGLWHGAAWTFVAWGALHGFYLCINHAFHVLRRRFRPDSRASTPLELISARTVTFLAVVVGWVLFRAESFDSALIVLRGMVGLNGVSGESAFALDFDDAFVLIGIAMAIALVGPNTNQIMASAGGPLGWSPPAGADGEPVEIRKPLRWKPTLAWSLIIAILLTLSIMFLSRASEFLYYQF